MSKADAGPGSPTVQRQEAYVAARIGGASPTEAKLQAGYAARTSVCTIEKRGGPVAEKMRAALAAKGITEEFLAHEYERGLRESTVRGAKEADYGAHARYLMQLGYLLGYGRQSPQLAVQINNGGPQPPESIGGEDFAERLEALVARLEVVAGPEELSDVSEGIPGATGGPGGGDDGAVARADLGAAPGDQPPVGGGGSA